MKQAVIKSYTCRLAKTDTDLTDAFALRHQSFKTDTTTGLECDAFDQRFEHAMIEDPRTGQLVCTFRFKHIPDGSDLKNSYAAKCYDLSKLSHFDKPMLELSRFCISPETSDPNIIRTAWACVNYLIQKNEIEFIFGCSSFNGTDKKKYEDAFVLLKERHLAPEKWQPFVKAKEVFPYAKELAQNQLSIKRAHQAMPPLLRTYLSLGAWVSDHAAVDNRLNTLHVFTGLEINKIPENRKRFLQSISLEIT